MPRIALVTAQAVRGSDHDMPPLLAALRRAGADAREFDWDGDVLDWSRFDLALLRSTWDYFERLPVFLAWAERVSRQTLLLNPLDVLRWNTDKHYLADLAGAGVAVVPSTFVEPGDEAGPSLDAWLDANPGPRDLVVKPAVGAGSRDAQRHARDQRDAILAQLRRLLEAGRSALLQPYLERIDEHGETALLFFDGKFSHAVRKGPLLQRGADATTGLFAPEEIVPRAPDADELELAHRALAAVPFGKPLAYARVDVIRDDAGTPQLLELELVEPSVFVGHAPGAAERFAEVIMRRVQRAPPGGLRAPFHR